MQVNRFAVAVVGTGFIGPVHVEGLRRAGQDVVGIVGSTPEKSRAAAQALGIPRAYGDFAELLADDQVQSVHITSPNKQHFEQAAQALAAGKHVLCEKPLAMTSSEAAELVRRAAASDRAAGVNYNIRYYPLCIEARARRLAGALGAVRHVAGSYVQDWLFHDRDFNWRVLAVDGGELRAVADIGTHWLDLVQHVTGLEIAAVCADLLTVHPVRRRPVGGVETFRQLADEQLQPVAVSTEDYGGILLRFSGGARGVVWVSQVTAGRKNCLRFELAGSQCSLAWNSESPNELWIGQRDRPNEVLLRDPALVSPSARAVIDYPGGHTEGFPETFKQCFRDFYGCITRGEHQTRPTFPTFADGAREIALCEAVLASSRSGGWVEVAATPTGRSGARPSKPGA